MSVLVLPAPLGAIATEIHIFSADKSGADRAYRADVRAEVRSMVPGLYEAVFDRDARYGLPYLSVTGGHGLEVSLVTKAGASGGAWCHELVVAESLLPEKVARLVEIVRATGLLAPVLVPLRCFVRRARPGRVGCAALTLELIVVNYAVHVRSVLLDLPGDDAVYLVGRVELAQERVRKKQIMPAAPRRASEDLLGPGRANAPGVPQLSASCDREALGRRATLPGR
jgi:hypothetical protein